GAGSVLNGLRPEEGASFAVFGTGSVGLSALMAAKVAGCGTIIAVDLNADRLALAKELGATHTVNPNDGDAVKQVREITGLGVDYSLECTGNPQVIRQAIDVLGPRGTCGWVGLAPIGSEVSFDSNVAMNKGVTIKGLIEGESQIDEFIPQLIDLYMSGKFPIERLIRFYDFDQINEAEKDHGSGVTIKAILRMPE
ncbi:MAG: zinc-binding dehydrogenase, partial [Alphaproteobacteria bacterium]|nr:zinc-binding dehydrogenase [Alphaproteobacteria bacterium]